MVGRRCTRRRVAPATAAAAAFGLTLLRGFDAAAGAAAAGVEGSAPEPAIRVERESFWYEVEPGSGAEAELLPAAGSVVRVVAALEVVLRRHARRFPQPPPLPIVVRGSPRDDPRAGVAWIRTLGAYGCATLVDGVVVVEVTPSTFVGRRALNDAELRAFLGHELVHAYQYAAGSHDGDPGQLVRREIEALEWELAALEPEVREPYREDVRANLAMYRAMLDE